MTDSHANTQACLSVGGEPGWAYDRSHRPSRLARRLPPGIVEAVRLVRLSLYNQGLLCGAPSIRWVLDALGVAPLPAIRTINRILAREGLPHRSSASRGGRCAA